MITKADPATGTTPFAAAIAANVAYWLQRSDALGNRQIRQLQPDCSNIARAIEFGLALADTRPAAARLLLAMYPVIERNGYWRAWIPLLEKARAGQTALEPDLEVRILDRLGQFYRLDRQLERSLKVHGEEVAAAGRMDDAVRLAQAHLNLSQTYWTLRNYDESESHALAALAAHQSAAGEPDQAAAIYTVLGLLAYGRGDWATAEGYLAQAVDIYGRLELPALLARSLVNLALALEGDQQVERALAAYQEALALLADTDFELDKVRAELSLGTLYLNQNRLAEAEAAYLRAYSPFLRRSGIVYYQALALNNLAAVCLEMGRLEDAECYVRDAMRLWHRAGGRLWLGNAYGLLGRTLLAQGRLDEAEGFLDQALEIIGAFADDSWAQGLYAEYAAAAELLAQQMAENGRP